MTGTVSPAESAETHACPCDSSNQTSWRKANLTCKIAIDNLEKAELLQGGDLLRQRYLCLLQRQPDALLAVVKRLRTLLGTTRNMQQTACA